MPTEIKRRPAITQTLNEVMIKVPTEMRPPLKGPGATAYDEKSPFVKAMKDGETLFFGENFERMIRNRGKLISGLGYLLHIQKGEYEGVKGFYVWAEKRK